MSRVVCHFSCGAASAVATRLALSGYAGDEVVIAYAETGSEDPDNARFMADCERWFGREIVRLRNPEYRDTWHVWEKQRYIAGVAGAPCTGKLKVLPRMRFQRPDDIHVFGYTADSRDIRRAESFREHWPDLQLSMPLIKHGLNKAACLALLENYGINPPITYVKGLPNANCIPCCKAQSPAYWALIRREYPAQFNRMAVLSRELGAKLAKLNGERIFIDSVPLDFPTIEAIAPACDFLCQLAEQEMV